MSNSYPLSDIWCNYIYFFLTNIVTDGQLMGEMFKLKETKIAKIKTEFNK